MKGFKLDLMTGLAVIVIVGVVLTMTVQANSGSDRRAGSVAAIETQMQQAVARIGE